LTSSGGPVRPDDTARRVGGLPVPGAGKAGQGSLLADRYRLGERLREQEESAQWWAVDEALSRTVTVYVLAPGSGLAAGVTRPPVPLAAHSDPRLVRILDADDRTDLPFVVAGWPSGVCLADLAHD
jgi:hypothetical protein